MTAGQHFLAIVLSQTQFLYTFLYFYFLTATPATVHATLAFLSFSHFNIKYVLSESRYHRKGNLK